MTLENGIDGYLTLKTNDIVTKVLGDKISADKKEQLVELLSLILRKTENKLLETSLDTNYQMEYYSNYPPTIESIPTPTINIIYCSFPQTTNYASTSSIPMSFYMPPQISTQFPVSTNYPTTPNYLNNYTNYFQPNLFNYNMPIIKNVKKKSKSKPIRSKAKSKNSEKVPKKEKSTKSKKSFKKIDDQITSEIQDIKYDPSNRFKGILSFLATKTGGNIHDNGTIEITASSVNEQKAIFGKSLRTYDPKLMLNNLKDPNKSASDFYAPKNGINEFWICFDFKKYRVQINGYLIKSTRFFDVLKPKNWVIEISDNGKNWKEIDNQNDCVLLKGGDAVANFEIKSKTKFSRFCRFRHFGECWKGSKENGYIGISFIEFYGKLKS